MINGTGIIVRPHLILQETLNVAVNRYSWPPHPVDRQVYYYKEGMAAPMGSFKNFQRRARAVMAIDRTLQETQPGHYETVARLTESGTYDVAFFMESPRIIHCFATRIMPNLLNHEPAIHVIAIELLPYERIKSKQINTLNFRIRDTTSGQLLTDINNLQALIVGSWLSRLGMIG